MNELDVLMNKDPLELSAQDIDGIIAYQRQRRADFEAGVKPKKETGPKADIAGLLDRMVPKEPPLVRRVLVPEPDPKPIEELPKAAEPVVSFRRRLV